MKKILLSMAAVSALAIGAPAAAQYSNGGWQTQTQAYGNAGVSNQLGQIDARIRAGVQSGSINRSEAARLDMQLRELARIERQYARGGINARERADLQMRLRNLREQIRYSEGRTGNGRYGNDRYGNGGYDDRYGNDRNSRYGDNRCMVTADWIDRNRDGYDDRDLNRNGSWHDDAQCDDRYGNNGRWDNNGRYGNRDRDDRYGNNGRWDNDGRYGNRADRDRDGRWDDDVYRNDRDDRWGNDRRDRRYEPRSNGGGIGGILGSVLGGGGMAGAVLGSILRVGQRAGGGLFAVPNEYQSQFRDTSNVYYRSDGQAIYAIDARTQTVLQVHPIRR